MGDSEKTMTSRRLRGMELSEIKPVMVGGNPLDPKNKTWLTREQHIEVVRYWNRVISDLRKQPYR